MAGAVGQVVDARVVWETPRLVNVEPIVRNRLVDVELVISLPGVCPDVRETEPSVPSLVLDRQVVLHAVGRLDVRADCGRDADCGRPRDAVRKDAWKDDDRVIRGIGERRFVDHEGRSTADSGRDTTS